MYIYGEKEENDRAKETEKPQVNEPNDLYILNIIYTLFLFNILLFVHINFIVKKKRIWLIKKKC